MRLSKKRRESHISFKMTPMIDIVFLLIIFFMTVSQITRIVDQPIRLPSVERGTKPIEPVAMTVNLDRAGKIFIAAKPYQTDEFFELVNRQLAAVDNRPDLLKVRLRCDGRCDSRHSNAILRRLSATGVINVRIAVTFEPRMP